jgi:hypothetical protein
VRENAVGGIAYEKYTILTVDRRTWAGEATPKVFPEFSIINLDIRPLRLYNASALKAGRENFSKDGKYDDPTHRWASAEV